eukprot:scaffold576_cov336-Pavlova_lutheri.AAC.7
MPSRRVEGGGGGCLGSPPLPSISISHRSIAISDPKISGPPMRVRKGNPRGSIREAKTRSTPGGRMPLLPGDVPLEKGGIGDRNIPFGGGGGGGGSPIHSIDTFRALVRRESTRAASKTHQVRLSGSWRRTPACIRERKEMESDGCVGRSRDKPQGRKRPTSWKPWCEWTSTNARLTCGKRWTRRMPAVRIRLRREFLEPG